MKNLIFIVISLFVANVMAKPLFLITSFDAFNGHQNNNSQKIAELILKKMESSFTIIHCQLPTSFQKSLKTFEDCYQSLAEKPAMVLSLGETGCNLKIEHRAINKIKVTGPDNDEYFPRGEIMSWGEKFLGMTYPLEDMFCSLSSLEKSKIVLSKDAGTFVCNDLSYKILTHYPELSFGFIHVPSANCSNIDLLNDQSVNILSKLLLSWDLNRSNTRSLPISKDQLTPNWRQDVCKNEYYKRIRL